MSELEDFTKFIGTYNGEDNISLELPTGTGKTTKIPPKLVDEYNKRVLVAVPNRALVFRITNYLNRSDTGYAVGGEKPHFDERHNLVYVTVGWFSSKLTQYLSSDKIPNIMEEFNVAIIDEIHCLDTEYVILIQTRIQ